MPDTRRRNLRCSAIWNGCKCDRYPHEGNGHVWRNTLDGDLVDPALYPSAAHIDALTAAVEGLPSGDPPNLVPGALVSRAAVLAILRGEQ